MTRQTSIEAYNEIKDEGLLRRLQFQVYDALYSNGPMTQGELTAHAFPGTDKTVTTPRFAELAKLGVIAVVGKRPCRISGRNCMVWDVTTALPEKPEKKETKDQQIRRLKARVQELETELRRIQKGELF